ncbi:MAG: selenocysteine-specific translation elongation factor [Fimbriimonadaceae bacterium]|nr:selenocysteine-specific translation elongation factor [Fimbriimonadaceae bacterium]
MAKLIGTAGHVDHGKTTLIRALTGIDADRLPEEKRRGMTIDIGFAFIDLPEIGRVSIVDVPGHEKFIHNMLVGAQGVDVALLCVSADEAVMPQTREHLQILELLPVDKLVIALTRADLADAETREIALLDVQEAVAKTRFGVAPTIPVSAFTGEGIDQLKLALRDSLNTPDKPITGPWYLPVDRAFTVKGHGVVVTGTLSQGRVKTGDKAVLVPGDTEVRVRGIRSHNVPFEQAEKGQRTALNLSGIKLEDVERGMAVGEPGALFETWVFDAKVTWIAPVKHGMRVRISIGSEEAIAKLFLNDKDPEIAQFRLDAPIACAMDQPLIIRRYSPPDLLGGGRVVIPQSKPRRKSEKAVIVEQKGTDEEAILSVLEDQITGVTTDEICRRLGKTPQTLGISFEKLLQEGKLLGFAGLWYEPSAFETAAEKYFETLLFFHQKTPTQAMLPRERISESAKLKWAGKPLDRILAHLSSQGRVIVQGTMIRHPEFRVQLSPRQRALLDRVTDLLTESGLSTPNVHDIGLNINIPPQAAEEIMKLGIQAGEVVRIADGVFYTPAQLEEIKARMATTFGNKPFPASEFRDTFQTSRKYVIPLLEYFDAQRFTTRMGDNRVINMP